MLFCFLVLTMGLFTGEKKTDNIGEETGAGIGVFPVCYKIGTGKIGAISFTVHLMVNVVNHKVTGYGRIFKPVFPPLDIDVELAGNYNILVWNNKSTNIVHLTGFQELHWSKGHPLKIVRVHLFMALSKDWQSGKASYKYMGNDGEWKMVNDVPVKPIPCWTKGMVLGKGGGYPAYQLYQDNTMTTYCSSTKVKSHDVGSDWISACLAAHPGTSVRKVWISQKQSGTIWP